MRHKLDKFWKHVLDKFWKHVLDKFWKHVLQVSQNLPALDPEFEKYFRQEWLWKKELWAYR